MRRSRKSVRAIKLAATWNRWDCRMSGPHRPDWTRSAGGVRRVTLDRGWSPKQSRQFSGSGSTF
jgi:hypothetical protein